MKRAIAKPQFILLFSYVIFIAHTLAEPPEAVKNEFMAWRQRQREARLSAGTNRSLQSSTPNANPIPSENWAGAVQSAPSSDSINSVTAEWVVPQPGLPPNVTQGVWFVATWVGIDGQLSSCPNVVVQAGVYSWIATDASGAVVAQGTAPWYEWFPTDAVYFPNYPVVPQDPIKVTVTATSTSTAVANFSNSATGVTASNSFNAPSGGNMCGSTAEWIVENPGTSDQMANFDSTFFTNCEATTTSGATLNLDNSTLCMIVEGTSTIVATPLPLTSNILWVQYMIR